MNVTMINHQTFVQTIEESEILTKLSGPGANETIVATRFGTDILIVTDILTGRAIVIEPCSSDREAGGSIHDHARANADCIDPIGSA
jgi:hypothetical protein